jgi:tryptophan synthase beta chain
MDNCKILLDEKQLPQRWYNIQADLPNPLPPPINPNTQKPISPDDLAPIFPKELIKQEVSQERWIDIPDEVRRILLLWRPTPLHRARNLEKALKTPARIYYKNESVNGAGSHKPNTAVAQAYFNKKEGVKRLSTETGAGQWGSALSFACRLLGLKCTVYMVKCSYEQKPFRKSLMHVWGAEVFASPTNKTKAGRSILKKMPHTPGSLGIAISEAVEDAATHDDTKYALGSVLNHVMLHQTVIGLETEEQLKLLGEKPDVMIGCVGGGSNFAGLVFPFVKDKIKGKINTRFIAVEPTACPTLTKGPYRYDFGDTAQMTPLLKMYTLGHNFIPQGIHAGGLRYHGMSPLVSILLKEKLIEAVAYAQTEVFKSAVLFSGEEGILPAPETSHAIKAVVDEALRCKEDRREKCIVFNFSGHGNFDLAAYENYLSGKMQDYNHPEDDIKKAIKELPEIK